MMDSRELAQRIKALQGSLAKNEPATEIISQINLLKKEVTPTEDMLRQTNAGRVMGKLRQNANKDIARLATEVVAKWKKAVEADKNARASKHHKPSASPRPSASPAPKTAAMRSDKKYEGDPEKRTWKTDNIDIKRTDSVIRDNCIGLLYNGLGYRSVESPENVIVRAIEVEHAAYKAYDGESKVYKEKIRSLYQNLKVKTNPELGQHVMSGEITAQKFVRMTSKELMSAEMRKHNQELEKENMKKAQVPMAEKSISDTLECSNCKKKMVSYTQAQTRSADEPMTTFCECLNCGKRWKFS